MPSLEEVTCNDPAMSVIPHSRISITKGSFAISQPVHAVRSPTMTKAEHLNDLGPLIVSLRDDTLLNFARGVGIPDDRSYVTFRLEEKHQELLTFMKASLDKVSSFNDLR
jgi:hypothetical protein